MMDRRAFFRAAARPTRPPVLDLSCEQLYMRYLDGKLRGSVARLFARLERDLARVGRIRLRELAWLERDEEFRSRLTALFARFEARGGRIERS